MDQFLIMGQISIEWQTIVTNINWAFVVNLVQFFILVFIMNRLIYRPLLKFMDARDQRLNDQLAAAEQQRSSAETLRAQREGELQQASLQARKTLEVARAEAAEARRQLQAEAEDEGRKLIEAARAQAKSELASVRTELEGQVDHLAGVAAAHVLGK